MLLSLVILDGALPRPLSRALGSSAKNEVLAGKWRVNFQLSGMEEKILEINSRAGGSGSFVLVDDGPNGKAGASSFAAAWTPLSNDRVSFSGDIELQIGTCCREMGTLMLKGKVHSTSLITGRAVFVTSTIDEENVIGFRSMVGAFSAARLLN